MGLGDESYLIDTIMVGVSLFLVVGYHVYLWLCFINKPLNTTLGFQSQARKAWFNQITQVGDEKKSMQVVQSLRNNMMIIILRGTISIIISSSVAAFTNNAYNCNNKGKSRRGGGGEWVYAVKYACALMVLMWSFMCSSLGVGFLIDTSVSVSALLLNGNGERMVERGFMLGFIGNRLMWVGLLLLLWSFTPIAVLFGSLALIWCFFVMDFGANANATANNGSGSGSFRFSLSLR